MKHLLRAIVILLTLALGVHAISMLAMPEMSSFGATMAQSGSSMPPDCASLCLINSHQMSVIGIAASSQQLGLILAVLVLFAGLIIGLPRPKYVLDSFRAKPPNIINLYGTYRI